LREKVRVKGQISYRAPAPLVRGRKGNHVVEVVKNVKAVNPAKNPILFFYADINDQEQE
jgi:hypothetical protein